jgi:hypothetical protein
VAGVEEAVAVADDDSVVFGVLVEASALVDVAPVSELVVVAVEAAGTEADADELFLLSVA